MLNSLQNSATANRVITSTISVPLPFVSTSLFESIFSFIKNDPSDQSPITDPLMTTNIELTEVFSSRVRICRIGRYRKGISICFVSENIQQRDAALLYMSRVQAEIDADTETDDAAAIQGRYPSRQRHAPQAAVFTGRSNRRRRGLDSDSDSAPHITHDSNSESDEDNSDAEEETVLDTLPNGMILKGPLGVCL